MILLELFHTSYDWNVKQTDAGFEYTFVSSNSKRYVMSFDNWGNGMWAIFFIQKYYNDDSKNRNGILKITGTGNSIEIFGILADCIKHFIKTNHPKILTFSGEKNRAKLYDALSKKIASELGWKNSIHDFETGKMYTISEA